MVPLTTKIIAGKYKGKSLFLPSLEVTRSSKVILRGSVFNSLQYDIIDKVFVEAFSGSGSMGLESLSRGAKSAYFIEKDKNSYAILKKNCQLIDPEHCYTILGDTFVEFPKIAKQLIHHKGGVVFYFDPPFSYRDEMDGIYEKCFELVSHITKEQAFAVIFEHMSILKMPEQIGDFHWVKTRKFGKSSLTYYA